MVVCIIKMVADRPRLPHCVAKPSSSRNHRNLHMQNPKAKQSRIEASSEKDSSSWWKCLRRSWEEEVGLELMKDHIYPIIMGEVLQKKNVTFSNHLIPNTIHPLSYADISIPWLLLAQQWQSLHRICDIGKERTQFLQYFEGQNHLLSNKKLQPLDLT